ncbi:MAG TPA: KpsF/GutQ family sugar-phosphate isomerase [Blastocatellia bacterium]|nr:KpsF/GutQ family sugar-phosphate isomerase [Blastocatellia bacterium]
MNNNFAKVIGLLRLEAEAIECAAGNLSREDVENAIAIIAACESKVIVMGVGKSGVIAQKIAQTLTSTGTVAVFVHPSDALHGSLGMAAKGDIVLALSNSGETDEILALLPALKKRKIPIISIVGNRNSTLALQSDAILEASVNQEICPLNLAPTTSTTVALAIGDAIAMTIMEARGLTAEDFAANHPAGRLGKRLTVRVCDLMHESPDVSPDSDWLAVVRGLSKYALGAVSVTEGDGKLVGIVTDGDLRRIIEKTPAEGLKNLTASKMMTRSPITAAPEMLAFEALRLMEDRASQISVLPVTDNSGKSVGLLRLHDIVRVGL